MALVQFLLHLGYGIVYFGLLVVELRDFLLFQGLCVIEIRGLVFPLHDGLHRSLAFFLEPDGLVSEFRVLLACQKLLAMVALYEMEFFLELAEVLEKFFTLTRDTLQR